MMNRTTTTKSSSTTTTMNRNLPAPSGNPTNHHSNINSNSNHSNNSNNSNNSVDCCDICWGRPKKKGMTYQKCTVCHVGVHNECYGIIPHDTVYDRFVCHACATVGTTVTGIIIPHSHQPRLSTESSAARTSATTTTTTTTRNMILTVKRRPTECCFCGIDNGHDYYNAMHPIYHREGPEGRHVILVVGSYVSNTTTGTTTTPAPLEYRLAWAHSLCCYAICSYKLTAGCVFGCTKDGSYDGVDNDNDSNDDDCNNNNNYITINHGNNHVQDHPPPPKPSKNHHPTTLAETTDASIHHFVMCLKLRPIDPDTPWTKIIREYQNKLKCMICGSNDRHSFRLAIQCSAGDDDEDPTYRAAHTSFGQYGTCYCAMHVGCAVWGRNDVGELPTNRRVYFFPGLAKVHSRNTAAIRSDEATGLTTVTRLYCPVHAAELQRAKLVGAEILRYPAHLLPPPPPPRDNTTTMRTTTEDLATTNHLSSSSSSALSTTVTGHGRHLSRVDPVRHRLGLLDPVPRPIHLPLPPPSHGVVTSHSRSVRATSDAAATTAAATTTTTTTAGRSSSSSTRDVSALPQHEHCTESLPPKQTTRSLTRPLTTLVRAIQNTPSITSTSTVPNPKRVRRTASKNTIYPTHLKHAPFLNTDGHSGRHGSNPLDPSAITRFSHDDAPGATTNMDHAPTFMHDDNATEFESHHQSESMPFDNEMNEEPFNNEMNEEPFDNEMNEENATQLIHSPQQQQKPPILSNQELIEQIVNEITANEEMGEYHLDRIFQDTEQSWKDQLFVHDGKQDRGHRDYTKDEFQRLWSTVLERCLSEKFPYYSFVRSNWKGAASSSGRNKMDHHHSRPTTGASPSQKNDTPTTTTIAHSNDQSRSIAEWETMELISLEDLKSMTNVKVGQ